MGISVLLVRFVYGLRPLADPLLGGIAVPTAIPVREW
jgi:hypothetical protein